jgi:four helix bundle protein
VERTNFEKLRVYSLAEKLSDHIWNIVRKWEHLPRDTIGRQMIRAADSIGANIAEGSGRGTLNDNRRFIRMARGSLYETKHWLRRAYTRSLLDDREVAEIEPLISELSPTLNAYFSSVNKAAIDDLKQRTKHKAPSSKA